LSPGLGCFDACIRDCKQIGHRLGFLQCDLFHGLHVADSVMESVNDLDILVVRDSIPGVRKIFHVVLKAFIKFLPDGLEGLSSRWSSYVP
jgi:hypothetical protein